MDWNVTSVGKPIPASYTTKVANGTVLVDIMNKAANEDTNGPYNRWTSTYYSGLGHAITSMNGTQQVCVEHLNSSDLNVVHTFCAILSLGEFGRLVKIKRSRNER